MKCVCLSVVTGLICSLPTPMLAQPKEAVALQATLHRVIDEAEPSVACILVSRSERYRDFRAAPLSDVPGKLGAFNANLHMGPFIDPTRRNLVKRLDLAQPDAIPESYGSGVVIDAEKGLILTTFHVVRNATKVYVRLPDQRGSYADIHAADGRSDLAVLRLLDPPQNLKAIRLGDAGKARKGDWVVSLANPFAAGFRDGSPSASWGILSNVRRRAPGAAVESERIKNLHQYGTLLQTDARLNLGCSGGAILNMSGEMIGLTTALAALTGGETAGGYAMPLDLPMRKMIEILCRGEEIEYGFLGVSVKPDEIPDSRGVEIDGVSDGSPAERAGLFRGQVIRAINGNRVRNLDDMFLQIAVGLAGNDVLIEVETASGAVRKMTARLSKFSNPFPVIASNRPAAVFGLRVDYGSVLNTKLPIPAGVSIREVDRDSPAEQKLKEFVENGKMLIVAVNGKPVATPSDFYREAAASKDGLVLKLVEVTRNPEATAKTVKLP